MGGATHPPDNRGIPAVSYFITCSEPQIPEQHLGLSAIVADVTVFGGLSPVAPPYPMTKKPLPAYC